MARSPSVQKRFRRPTRRKSPVRLWGKDELDIDRMSQEGRGIATRQGKIVFVAGALQGERVQVQCIAVKRDYDEAVMLHLAHDTAASAERVAPPCPVYQQCGGCTLQHWSLEAQQHHKQTDLLAKLQTIAPGLNLDPAITSGASGFRHRLRLLVKRNPDKSWWLGMRQRGSHDAVAIGQCLVANTDINAMISALPTMLDSVPELQGLREIEVDSDSYAQLGLCFYFAAKPGEKALAALRRAVWKAPVTSMRARLLPPRRSRQESENESDNDLAGFQELYVEGELKLSLTVSGQGDAKGIQPQPVELTYLPGDFTQTHWEVNTALLTRALNWLQPDADEQALDLFCGIGNFSLPLARLCKTVHALEGDDDMTRRLSVNAARNQLENICASTINLMADNLQLPKAEIAIIDPPRAGAKAVCEVLARSRVKRLVYISCHPATLQRDARILADAGFILAKAAAVDMFPHTGHSEAIALFQRKQKRKA